MPRMRENATLRVQHNTAEHSPRPRPPAAASQRPRLQLLAELRLQLRVRRLPRLVHILAGVRGVVVKLGADVAVVVRRAMELGVEVAPTPTMPAEGTAGA